MIILHLRSNADLCEHNSFEKGIDNELFHVCVYLHPHISPSLKGQPSDIQNFTIRTAWVVTKINKYSHLEKNEKKSNLDGMAVNISSSATHLLILLNYQVLEISNHTTVPPRLLGLIFSRRWWWWGMGLVRVIDLRCSFKSCQYWLRRMFFRGGVWKSPLVEEGRELPPTCI